MENRPRSASSPKYKDQAPLPRTFYQPITSPTATMESRQASTAPETYANWRAKMLDEIGTDPMAVIRDFPRMCVFVSTGKRHNYDTTMHTSTMSAHAAEVPISKPRNKSGEDVSVDGFAERIERVLSTVLLLSELSGEAATFGEAFRHSWKRQQERAEDLAANPSTATADDLQPSNHSIDAAESPYTAMAPRRRKSNLSVHPPARTYNYNNNTEVSAKERRKQARTEGNRGPISSAAAALLDVHEMLKIACLESHMISEHTGGEVAGDDGVADVGSFGTVSVETSASAMAARRFTVRSSTFHLMEFLVQGVMFYPYQRMRYCIEQPWMGKMEDQGWTVHVYPEETTSDQLDALKQQKRSRFVYGGGTNNNGTNANSFDDEASPLMAPAPIRHQSALQRRAAGAAEDVTQRPYRVIVIHHVQTCRHHPDSDQPKSTPRFELDLECKIRVEADLVHNRFAAYQPSPNSPVVDGQLHHLSRLHRSEGNPLKEGRGGGADLPAHGSPTLRITVPSTTSPQAADGTTTPGAEGGVAPGSMRGLVYEEVLFTSARVVGARVETSTATCLCWRSSDFDTKRKELADQLMKRYHVYVEDVKLLPNRR